MNAWINFLVNALVSIIPAVILYLVWGRRAVLLMAPALLYAMVLLLAQIIPDTFAPFPKGSSGSEACFRVVIVSVIVLFVLHCLLLSMRNYSLTQITMAEILQLPAWIYLWYVVAVTLQGGK